MPKDGTGTRTHIVDAAEALILAHGFAGTSVEMIVDRAGVTKGAFFHHFGSKADLARAVATRYAAVDSAFLATTMDRAERLSREPVQQLLVFVGLCAEAMEEQPDPHPGCLFASYTYQALLFDARTHEIIRETTLLWRERVSAKIREAVVARPPRIPVDADALADMLWVTLEGAFLLSRTLREPRAVASQVRQYLGYLELLFGAS